jgi:RNase P/RNase MRP subunit POP5
VAGDQPIPPSQFELELRRRLTDAFGPDPLFKVVRFDGSRGLVRLGHRNVPAARQAWNRPLDPTGRAVPIRTLRSYGTLRKGKLWMRIPASRSAGAPVAPDGAYK